MLLLPDNAYLPELKACVAGAEKEISIATFKIEAPAVPQGRPLLELLTLLEEKAKSAVKIRLLINYLPNHKCTPRTNEKVMSTLKAAGASVRYLSRGRCCHAKIAIIDTTAAFFGSHNLSVKSCLANFELSCKETSTLNIKEIAAIFDKAFAAATEWKR